VEVEFSMSSPLNRVIFTLGFSQVTCCFVHISVKFEKIMIVNKCNSTADMSQLRSLLALQQFMRACGEAVEESEAVSLFSTTSSPLH
jgi:hypothetical protein